MKLLLITAVKTFEQDIKSILKKSRVNTFSYTQVTGYKSTSDNHLDENWFSSGHGEHESILFYVIVENDYVSEVMQLVNELNEEQESQSRIHVAALEISEFNKI